MKTEPITISTKVNAPLDKAWEYWTAPEHTVNWYFASDDWVAPSAENDLKVGGTFKTAMAAKDGSEGFDFTGTYTVVEPKERIEYDMDDGRHVSITFAIQGDGVEVTETFDAEQENSIEQQRAGWQAILDNFKKYTENN